MDGRAASSLSWTTPGSLPPVRFGGGRSNGYRALVPISQHTQRVPATLAELTPVALLGVPKPPIQAVYKPRSDAPAVLPA
jgi:hypothetical protein